VSAVNDRHEIDRLPLAFRRERSEVQDLGGGSPADPQGSIGTSELGQWPPGSNKIEDNTGIKQQGAHRGNHAAESR